MFSGKVDSYYRTNILCFENNAKYLFLFKKIVLFILNKNRFEEKNVFYNYKRQNFNIHINKIWFRKISFVVQFVTN